MVGKDCRKLISRPAVFFTEQENIEIFILQKKGEQFLIWACPQLWEPAIVFSLAYG